MAQPWYKDWWTDFWDGKDEKARKNRKKIAKEKPKLPKTHGEYHGYTTPKSKTRAALDRAGDITPKRKKK